MSADPTQSTSDLHDLLKRALPYVAAERDETRVRDAWNLTVEICEAVGLPTGAMRKEKPR